MGELDAQAANTKPRRIRRLKSTVPPCRTTSAFDKCYHSRMLKLSRTLRVIAAAILIGTGLSLFSALIHIESAMHGAAIVKARRTDMHAHPASTLGAGHRHS